SSHGATRHPLSRRRSSLAPFAGRPGGSGAAAPAQTARVLQLRVRAEIEEVGWGQLVSATGDDGVSCLTFRVMDEQRRHHLLEITLPMNYPACPPSIAADVPYLPKLQWSESSRLKDVLCQFQEHLKVLQDYWSTMDGIDKALWVVDPTKPTYAMSHHRIALGDDCYILLHVDTHKPNSLPE
uniref:FANCL UBC-like domain-containing protein n=2 Tax=Aegilops tauschii subsp. strangulata TaxID=200361 RepID=A0A453H9I3_AEGTS